MTRNSNLGNTRRARAVCSVSKENGSHNLPFLKALKSARPQAQFQQSGKFILKTSAPLLSAEKFGLFEHM